MDAVFNDKDEVHPVNVPNASGALPGFDDDLVVEVPGRCGDGWVEPLPAPRRCPATCAASSRCSASTRRWRPRRPGAARAIDGVRALAANPLVLSLDKAEPIYDELADAHREYLPERLLALSAGLARGRRRQLEDASRSSRDDGTIVGPGRGGAGDLYSAPSPGPPSRRSYRAVDAALEAPGATRDELAAAAFSLAGADWPEDFALHRAAASAALPGLPVGS